MERFLVLTTLSEQLAANKACAALEDAGIPVMLEHVEILEGSARACGYRILVPAQFTQTAMKLVSQSKVARILKSTSII